MGEGVNDRAVASNASDTRPLAKDVQRRLFDSLFVVSRCRKTSEQEGGPKFNLEPSPRCALELHLEESWDLTKDMFNFMDSIVQSHPGPVGQRPEREHSVRFRVVEIRLSKHSPLAPHLTETAVFLVSRSTLDHVR